MGGESTGVRSVGGDLAGARARLPDRGGVVRAESAKPFRLVGVWFLEVFGEVIALGVDPALTRIRAWRAYRQLYSAAERKEHKRLLAARPPCH